MGILFLLIMMFVFNCVFCVLTQHKNIFLCVAYGQLSKNILNILFCNNKYLKLKKKCFSMDFLNTKIIFMHFEFYNMFVNFKRCWSIFQKYKNFIFGQFILIHY
jgi:hypothetical protein